MNYFIFILTDNNRKSKINQIVFVSFSQKKVGTGWPKAGIAFSRARDPGSFSLVAPQSMVPFPRSPLSTMAAPAPAIKPTFQVAEWRK